MTPSLSTLPKRTDVAKTRQENSQHGITEPPDPPLCMGLRVQGFPFIYQESVCACMLSQPGSLYLVGIRPLAPILITLSCLLRPCSLPLPKCGLKKNRVNPLTASVLCGVFLLFFLYSIHPAAYFSVLVGASSHPLMVSCYVSQQVVST